MTMKEFRELLYSVDRSYDDFVSLIISFIQIPKNRPKARKIQEYILEHPFADSSDVLQFSIEQLGMAGVSQENQLVQLN